MQATQQRSSQSPPQAERLLHVLHPLPSLLVLWPFPILQVDTSQVTPASATTGTGTTQTTQTTSKRTEESRRTSGTSGTSAGATGTTGASGQGAGDASQAYGVHSGGWVGRWVAGCT